MWIRTYVILGRVCPCTTYFTESKDGFIFKRAGYRKSYAMQNRAGLHEIVLGSASVMQRRRFFYSVKGLGEVKRTMLRYKFTEKKYIISFV